MFYLMHCMYPIFIYILVPFLILCAAWRICWRKKVQYRYSLAARFKNTYHSTRRYHMRILLWLRIFTLFLLILLVARPQLVDVQSKIQVEGIDICLVMDVSGSMQISDFQDDNRSRIDVAKDEAVRFVQKREDDALGLVVFAKDAVTRCPLTLDHTLLRDIIYDLQIGMIDPDRTMLATGMITAVNRLKSSTAKSKIMILLTDGEPSEEDMDMNKAVEAARAFGIKIYTIGIGSEQERFMMHPFYGPVRVPKVNRDLLMYIAEQTGGRYFHVQSAQDMRVMYDVIDELERSSREHKQFKRYHELVIPIGFVALCLFVCEMLLSTYAWFML